MNRIAGADPRIENASGWLGDAEPDARVHIVFQEKSIFDRLHSLVDRLSALQYKSVTICSSNLFFFFQDSVVLI